MPLTPVSARSTEAGITIAIWPNSGSKGIVEKRSSQTALEDWVRLSAAASRSVQFGSERVVV
jgi:hypothetical protein